RADAAQRGNVGPARIPLVRVLEAPGERRRPLEVARVQGERDELEEEVVGIPWGNVVPRLTVVVEEGHVLARAALDALRANPVEHGDVPAVAAVVDRVDRVPEDLAAGVGIVLPDLRKRMARDVVGTLAGVAV